MEDETESGGQRSTGQIHVEARLAKRGKPRLLSPALLEGPRPLAGSWFVNSKLNL